MMSRRRLAIILPIAAVVVVAAAWWLVAPAARTVRGDTARTAATTAVAGDLTGTISMAGAPSVALLSKQIATRLGQNAPRLDFRSVSSTSNHGMRRLIGGQVEVCNAIRPITDTELEEARKTGVEVLEMTVALSGICVVVGKGNEFATSLTVEELALAWERNSTVKTWNDLRPTWPKEPIVLIGRDRDSGTYAYFAQAIVGKGKGLRTDIATEPDVDALAEAVAANPHALGYLELEEWQARSQTLRPVAVDGGFGPVAPSAETIRSGDYVPLSRPLIVYVSAKSADRPEIAAFIDTYLASVTELAPKLGYVPLSEHLYKVEAARFKRRITGTAY